MSIDHTEKTSQVGDQDLEEQQHPDAQNLTEKHVSSSNSSLDQAQEEVAKPPASNWADPSSFPDGGTEAWMTVLAASACFFVSWGWINCVGKSKAKCVASLMMLIFLRCLPRLLHER